MNEWKTPGKKTIVRCAVNQRQVVIALTGGELVYFEMDPVSGPPWVVEAVDGGGGVRYPGTASLASLCACPQSGQLNEYTERKEMSADVVCMSLANVPPGEQRSRFLAVGLADNTVRIISLDPSVRTSARWCQQGRSAAELYPVQTGQLCVLSSGLEGRERQS